MYPVLLRVGPFVIYSYGVMVALGLLLAVLLTWRMARTCGIDEENFLTLSICSIISGIIGARIFYVIAHLKEYTEYPLEILMIHHGGLVFYGGLLGGLLGGVVYARRKGLNSRAILDIVSPYMALGQAVARIGCFLNGCCYGKPTYSVLGIVFSKDSIAGTRFSGQALHPTQLYSAVGNVVIFIVLFSMEKKKVRVPDSPRGTHAKRGSGADTPRRVGEIFTLYLFFYSIKRFIIEFFRADTTPFFMGLTIFQLISIAIAGFSLFLIMRGRAKAGSGVAFSGKKVNQ